MERLATELFDQSLAQVLQDGRGLAFAAGGAEHEVVGNQRDTANVEEHNVAGQLVRREVDDSPRQGQRFGAVRGGQRQSAWSAVQFGRSDQAILEQRCERDYSTAYAIYWASNSYIAPSPT